MQYADMVEKTKLNPKQQETYTVGTVHDDTTPCDDHVYLNEYFLQENDDPPLDASSTTVFVQQPTSTVASMPHEYITSTNEEIKCSI
jgi:hypothetical protein